MKRNEQKDPFGPFDLNDFKKWMSHQQDKKTNAVGSQVESKVSVKKLLSRIETEEEIEEVAKDFKKNGGIIVEANGQKIKIEVDSGEFLIHKMYVKQVK